MESFYWALTFACIFAFNYGFGVNALGSIDPNVDSHVAKEDETPYYCAVYQLGSYTCGCAIISDKFVLTAAHCTETKKSNIEIVVGTTNLWHSDTRYEVADVTRNPNYNKPRMANDIAIIQIDGTIKFDDKVQPIKLSNQRIKHDTHAQTVGWGRFGDIPDAHLLRVVHVKTISTVDCQEKLRTLAHESNMCTLAEGDEKVCQENAGGPLVYNKELVGITNWVTCNNGVPSGFARISYFYNWIQTHIKSSQ